MTIDSILQRQDGQRALMPQVKVSEITGPCKTDYFWVGVVLIDTLVSVRHKYARADVARLLVRPGLPVGRYLSYEPSKLDMK